MNNRIRPFRKGAVLGGLTVLAAAVVCTGCGDSASVHGTIKYRGVPLPSGTVNFFGANNEILASAPIHDGQYAMQDVPAGPVKISVSTPPATPPDRRHPQASTSSSPAVYLPPQYGNPAQSGLTYEVTPGEQDHPIDLN